MIDRAKVVSIHPYFKVKAGNMDRAKGLLKQFMARTSNEGANLHYDFTINGDVVFCREAYIGAEGLLQHVENVVAVLQEFLKIADVLRVEIHGAPGELTKLKPALSGLNPEWFEFECGVAK